MKFFKKPKKKHVPVMAIVAIMILFVFRVIGNQAIVEEEPTKVVKSVELIELASLYDAAGKVEVNGQVESKAQVKLKSEVFAPVARVYVNLGDQVSVGQTLVAFNSADLSADLAQAQAGLEANLAQASVQQAALDRTRITAGNNIAAAKAVLQTAENNLKISQNTDTSQIVQDAYEDLSILLRSVHSSIKSAFISIDRILGVDNKGVNDAFETELFNQDPSTINQNTTKYRQLRLKRQNLDQLMETVNTASLEELDKMAKDSAEILVELGDMFVSLTAMVNSALPTGGSLDQASLDSLRTGLQTAQADVSTKDSSLTNQLQNIANAKTSLSTTEIAYNKAVQDLTDTEKQAEADIISAEAALRVQNSQVASSQASVKKVSALLSKTVIRSPISGVVSVLPAKVGELMSSGEHVVSVVNVNGLQVKTFVDSSNLKDISSGNEALVEGDYKAVVSHIAPSIDPITKKVEVITVLPEKPESLVVGQFVSLEIQKTPTEEQEIFLPLEAVKIGVDGKFVYTVNEENKVEKREVEVEKISGNKIQIISGLENLTSIVATAGAVEVGEEVVVS